MRTKYLLAAMALPLFAACTQDEFMGQGNEDATSALQNRVKVGKVTLTGDNADTRIDWETKQWQDGNVLGLFLMDETQWDEKTIVEEEEKDANKTWFMDQFNWNKMYAMSNYYNTNFPFKFDATDHSWKNDDAVVEGNYFAIAPANNQQNHLKKLTNRRDAWLYINPVQKFGGKENATGELNELRGGIDENQFFLGYTQIYRNQELTSDEKLQLPIQMRPILGMIDLAIMNTDEKKFKVEKIVISRNDGSPMPTLAYVRPANNTPENFNFRQDDNASLYGQQWAKMANDANIDKFEARFPGVLKGDAAWQEEGTWMQQVDQEGMPAFAQPYIVDSYKGACGENLSNIYWSQASWTRTAARSVVEYSYPGQNSMVPYGCTGEMARPAYEYVLDFTNAEGEGYLLNNGEFFHAYVALPHSMYLREYSFTIYGQQWNASRARWEEGIILPDFKGSYTKPVEGAENDGRFELQNLDLSSEKTYLEADIHFDDFNVTKSRLVQTTNAEDLLKHLKMYYGEDAAMDDNKNTYFYVETMGEFTITNELVDYVKMLNQNYAITTGSKPLIYFVNTTGAEGYGELVFPANLKATDAIDLFFYSQKVNLRNEGEQVITKPIIYNYNQTEWTLFQTLENSEWLKDRGIFNDGLDLLDKFEPAIADYLYGGIGTITNVEGAKLTIKNTIVDTEEKGGRSAIYNMEGAELIIDNSTVTGGIVDGDKFYYDMTDMSYTYIHNDGKMEIKNGSTVFGIVENNNVLNISAKGTSYIQKLLNITDVKCTNCGKQKAVTTINNGAALDVLSFTNGKESTINANGSLFTEIQGENRGLINVNAYSRISGKNYGRINVTDAKLTPAFVKEQNEIRCEFDLVNTISGVIYVKGDKAEAFLQQYTGNNATRNIINDGRIFVIGAANVAVSRGTGIIDVTEEAEGHQAKCGTTNDQFFLYRGVITDEDLQKLISSENWGKNPVILEFVEDKTYVGLNGNALSRSNVKNILVEKGKVEIEGSWRDMEVGNNPDKTVGLGGSYKALEVKAGATLMVHNDKSLETPATFWGIEETDPAKIAHITIDGYFHAENRAKVGGTSWVFGKGTVEYYSKSTDFKWVNKDNKLDWQQY